MATVFNNIDKVAGDPQISALVTIELVWDKRVSPVAKIEDEDTMVQGYYGTGTDDDGRWSVSLTANDEITPADSVYKILERISQGDVTTEYYISVPQGATAVYWSGDLIVEAPEWA